MPARMMNNWCVSGLALVMAAAVASWPAPAPAQTTQPTATKADWDYFLATKQFNDRKWELAAEFFRDFLKQHPSHARAADAQFGLAQATFELACQEKGPDRQSALYRQSAGAFVDLLGKFPKSDRLAEAQFQVGQCHLGAKEPEKAAAAFGQVVDRFADHHLAEWAAAKRGECLVILNRHAEGETVLAPLVEKYLAGKQAVEQLAARKKALAQINPGLADPFEALMARGLWYLALAQYEQRKFEASGSNFDLFVSRYPVHSLSEQARFYLGRALFNQARFDEAAVAFESAVQVKGPLAGAAAFEQAMSLYKSGDLKKASAAFAAMAAEFPTHPQAAGAALYAGTSLYEAAEYADAVKLLDQAARLKGNANADEAMYWKGMAQFKLGQFDQAEKTLAEAIKSFPSGKLLEAMKIARAEALLAQDKFAEAADAYESLAGDGAAPSRALYLAAFGRHRAARHADSAQLCARYLADYPDGAELPHVLFIAAENQFHLRDFAEAEKCYRKLLALKTEGNVDLDQAHWRLAWICYYREKYGEALGLVDLVKVSAGRNDAIATDAAYLRCVCLFQLQRDAEAAKALSDYLADDAALKKPNADDAMIKLALAQMRLGRRDEGIKTVERLIASFPDSAARAQAEYELANCHYYEKRFDAAAAHYQEAVKRDPKGPLAGYAVFGIGLCHYDCSQWREAADSFASVAQDFAARDDLLVQGLYWRGLSLQKLGEWSSAEAALNQLVERMPDDPLAPAAVRALAAGLIRQSRYDKAVEQLHRLLKSYPKSPNLDGVYYELAWCCMQLGQRDKMLDAYQALTSRFPASPLSAEAWLHLGVEKYQKKDYTGALDMYRRATEAARFASTQPDAAVSGGADRIREKVLYQSALCYWGQDRLEESAKQFDVLAKEYPQSSQLCNSLLYAAEAYLQMGRPAEAVARLNRLIAAPAVIGPGMPAFEHLDKAYLRLGQAQLRLGQAEKALYSLLTVREKFVGSALTAETDCAIGQALYELKKYDESIKALTKVTDDAKAPGELAAKAHYYVGQCNAALGRTMEAVKSFVRVSNIYANFPDWAAAAGIELGRIYLKQDNKPDAVRQFKDVAERYPNTRWSEAATAQLKNLGS